MYPKLEDNTISRCLFWRIPTTSTYFSDTKLHLFPSFVASGRHWIGGGGMGGNTEGTQKIFWRDSIFSYNCQLRESSLYVAVKYHRTRGISLTGLSPLARNFHRTSDKYFSFISILFLHEESSWQRYMDSYLQDNSGNRQYSTSNPCVRNSIFLWLCVGALNRGCAKNIQKTTSTWES